MGIIGFLNETQRVQTGFSYIIDNVDTYTPYGRELLKQLMPFPRASSQLLKKEFDEMDQLLSAMTSHQDKLKALLHTLSQFKDIRGSLKRCQNGNVLDDVELFEIKAFTRLLKETARLYKSMMLSLPSINFSIMDKVQSLLDPDRNGIPTFYIYDSYSKELGEIRRKKRSLEKQMLSAESNELLQSLRQERLDIVSLEEKEELKVRTILSSKLTECMGDFLVNIASISRLDLLLAKCSTALKFNAVRPEIGTPDQLYMIDGFNPQVCSSLKACKKVFTPVSIKLKSGMTVITGANMGGKSVTLKTLILNLMLFHMGFFVCAREACFPLLDFIELISDDLQSISQGLSTFGAEIMKLKEMLELAKNGTGFMGFDEFARGTNPNEGRYMAKALCTYLNKLSSISLLTTHYEGVADEAMVHYQVIGLKNVDFNELKKNINLKYTNSIDIIQRHMDYRLERVTSNAQVPKDALNISMLIGLDDEIISIAKNLYKKGDCN